MLDADLLLLADADTDGNELLATMRADGLLTGHSGGSVQKFIAGKVATVTFAAVVVGSSLVGVSAASADARALTDAYGSIGIRVTGTSVSAY
ncbi:hypothetical protein PlfCFBP13513_15735 [Plantibacter flavus]|nr:hypothetical protein PlfCFBP13513_15735 [Plantibacter flavus]